MDQASIRLPQSGDLYNHYKGNFYIVVGISYDDDDEPQVVYHAERDPGARYDHPAMLHNQKLGRFLGSVDTGNQKFPRFRYVKSGLESEFVPPVRDPAPYTIPPRPDPKSVYDSRFSQRARQLVIDIFSGDQPRGTDELTEALSKFVANEFVIASKDGAFPFICGPVKDEPSAKYRFVAGEDITAGMIVEIGDQGTLVKARPAASSIPAGTDISELPNTGVFVENEQPPIEIVGYSFGDISETAIDPVKPGYVIARKPVRFHMMPDEPMPTEAMCHSVGCGQPASPGAFTMFGEPLCDRHRGITAGTVHTPPEEP